MVDLAGSERVSKTRSEGSVLKEAGYINKSLSILEQVGGGEGMGGACAGYTPKQGVVLLTACIVFSFFLFSLSILGQVGGGEGMGGAWCAGVG